MLLRCECLVVVAIVTIVYLLLHDRPPRRTTYRRGPSPVAVSARHVPSATLPLQWSWLNVSESDATLWSQVHSLRLPPGQYVSHIVNQHRAGWCGACYLIATLHMIQNRANILLATTTDISEMRPWLTFDEQSMMDDFQKMRGSSLWNACQGGDPMIMMNCIATGDCKLKLSPPEGKKWFGFPRKKRDYDTANAPVQIDYFSRIENDDDIEHVVKGKVYSHGCVMVACSAENVMRCDANGVASGNFTDPNHAMVVIGWKWGLHGNTLVECWIVQNSWGTEHVPSNFPPDIHCVKEDANTCTTDYTTWRGMPDLPGHVLIPMSQSGEMYFYECFVHRR